MCTQVETIGDCYVAVAGLPEPRYNHAVVMARFARDCMYRLRDVLHRIEVELGPDTTDLTLRIGLHSGPVTAGKQCFIYFQGILFCPSHLCLSFHFLVGVLRGDRARFQLFG